MKKKILIVDDLLALRLLARKVLEKAGYCIIEASNGKEAVEILNKDYAEIGLVFLDIMMPNMDGLDTLKKVANLKKQAGFKICMLTAISDGKIIEECHQRGVDEFLIKPLDNQQLLATAHRLNEDDSSDISRAS